MGIKKYALGGPGPTRAFTNFNNPNVSSVDIGGFSGNGPATAGVKFPTNAPSVPGQGFDINAILGKASSGANSIMPFLSNAINAFRKPPAMRPPTSLKSISLKRVSMDNDRANVDKSMRSANLAADNMVDTQTAAAIKGANTAKGLDIKGDISAKEASINADISNNEARLNLAVEGQNAEKQDNYEQNTVAMRIAHQREQSENLANFSDKFMMNVARKDQMSLDRDKFNILSKAYGQSGVMRRLAASVLGKDEAEMSDDEFLGVVNGSKRAFGGKLGGGEPVPPLASSTYRTQAEVDAANAFARDFARRKGFKENGNLHVAMNVGDPKVQFLGEDGRPFTGKVTPTRLATTVPFGTTIDDIKSADGHYWYENNMGNIVDVDPSVVTKLRPAPALVMKAFGGKLGRMSGRIRKAY